MAATSKPRNTPQRGSLTGVRGYGLAAGVIAYAGAIAALNASGVAVPGSTATGLVALGRFAHGADNSGGAAGAVTVEVERGVFRYENSAAADEITAADIGTRCYLVDDQTVAKTHATNTRSVAGYVDDVDELGVWVLLDPTSGASA
ncbi:MAG: hypothetical protein ACK4KV_09580 [Rhodocyclaceae bacterium]